jgi:hypothetical protein
MPADRFHRKVSPEQQEMGLCCLSQVSCLSQNWSVLSACNSFPCRASWFKTWGSGQQCSSSTRPPTSQSPPPRGPSTWAVPCSWPSASSPPERSCTRGTWRCAMTQGSAQSRGVHLHPLSVAEGMLKVPSPTRSSAVPFLKVGFPDDRK